MMRRGEPWGVPSTAPPDLMIRGDDAELAEAVSAHRGARVALASPRSDIGRAVGVTGGASSGATELPFDVVDLDDGTLSVNAVVLGIAPDRLRRRHRRRPVVVHVDGRMLFDGRATTVVVATGQFLRGADVVPRGHPGDGRVEVQVYALDPGQRARMRRRLASGTHVPHPAISEGAGRRVQVSMPDAWAVEIDGRARPAMRSLTATVREAGWRLVV